MVVTAGRMLFFPMNRNVAIDAGLRPMLDTLKAGSRVAGWRLMAFGALAGIFAAPIILLPKDSPWPQWLTMAFSVFVAATSLLGLWAMHNERIQMEQLLRDALDAEEAKLVS